VGWYFGMEDGQDCRQSMSASIGISWGVCVVEGKRGRLFCEKAASRILFLSAFLLLGNNFQELHFEDQCGAWLDDRGHAAFPIGEIRGAH